MIASLKYKSVKDLFKDCDDLETTLLQLVGYVWAEGNTKSVMPDRHLVELVEYICDNYGDSNEN